MWIVVYGLQNEDDSNSDYSCSSGKIIYSKDGDGRIFPILILRKHLKMGNKLK